MSSFGRGLDDLIQLTKAGAIEPEAAVQSMYAMKDAQRDRRLARRQAQAEGSQAQFNDLASLATSGDYGSLADLARPAQATQLQYGASMLPQHDERLSGLLSSLYLPTDQTGFVGNAGLSRTNPNLPPTYSVAISQNVSEDVAAGTSPQEIRQNIHTWAQTQFGPSSYARLAPQIDAEIDRNLTYGTGRGY